MFLGFHYRLHERLKSTVLLYVRSSIGFLAIGMPCHTLTQETEAVGSEIDLLFTCLISSRQATPIISQIRIRDFTYFVRACIFCAADISTVLQIAIRGHRFRSHCLAPAIDNVAIEDIMIKRNTDNPMIGVTYIGTQVLAPLATCQISWAKVFILKLMEILFPPF